MQYTTITSKELIGRMYNDFQLDYSDWENRCPEWIAGAMENMEIFVVLEPIVKCSRVEDFKVKLPCHIKCLDAIKYKGRRLEKLGTINHVDEKDLEQLEGHEHGLRRHRYDCEESYELLGNGWITTTFEEGEVTFYYRGIPVEFDNASNIYYPLIPDNEKVKEAICYYILKMILSRGHIHPVYSLNSNNPVTNPAIAYERAKRAAMNSIGKLDRDARHKVSVTIKEFLTNPNAYYNEFFDNKHHKHF